MAMENLPRMRFEPKLEPGSGMVLGIGFMGSA